MKKFLFVTLIFIFLSQSAAPTSAAANFPNEFWALAEKNTAAVKNGDNQGVIDTSVKIINLLKDLPESSEFNSILATRSLNLAEAYENIGNYQKSKEAFDFYIPYARKEGWDDGIKIARAKILQYAEQFELYTASYSADTYYGAKLETKNGILCGVTSDSPIRGEIATASAVLLYHEFGDENFEHINAALKDAQAKNRAVEFALNIPREGNQIDEVLNSRDYITRISKTLSQYNIPIFFRLGAEMNVWTTPSDPSKFIDAFRFTASIVRENASNCAMLWSPNFVSSWNVNINDFYPGDEYVDWVGCSLYMQKYFLGRKDWSENEKFNELVFFAGLSASPVKMLNELASLYGDRKPIMISESGASHFTRTQNEDSTEWALSRLRELYSYVPMVYPQVKLMMHFERVMKNEAADYALSTNEAVKNEYMKLTNQPWFIKGNKDNIANQTFKKCYDGFSADKSAAVFYSYVSFFGKENIAVSYYIDDNFVNAASYPPYELNVDLNKYSDGNHILKAVAADNGVNISEKQVSFNVNKAIKIKINGETLNNLDTNPIIVDGRTLVPLRAVFEKTGAKVDWNDSTKTATVTLNGASASITPGASSLIKNGAAISLDVPAKLVGGRTLVPVRAISEAIGAKINWNSNENTVEIDLTRK